ncbi:POTE ankyrin domain family member F-like isoform X2 [Hydractinia symbiolongicarpus]|uniref:POTE ankyrin domain family member F-like isoform X2 n=1 Tax=Hydractinia symbiolongicarpus TaxID=13093 RepID=UPI00254B9C37|nr:POTE ankyrin domain family member F-like isoform X2 [Hydractinia symbiolongicarpus]
MSKKLKDTKKEQKISEHLSVKSSDSYNPDRKSYEKVEATKLPMLCNAVYMKDLQKVKKLLKLNPLKHLTLKDKNGRTAYHYAAFFGYKEILEELIKGSKLLDLLDSKDATGKTPLFKAVESCSVDCVDLLILQGCQTTTYEKSGTTALHVAVLANKIQLVEILVEDGKADINVPDQLGFTPLHLSCGLGYIEVVKYLLLHHANPNTKDKKGRTPLFGAAMDNSGTITELLLENGADPNVVDELGKLPAIPKKHKHLQRKPGRSPSPLFPEKTSQSRVPVVKHKVEREILKGTSKDQSDSSKESVPMVEQKDEGEVVQQTSKELLPVSTKLLILPSYSSDRKEKAVSADESSQPRSLPEIPQTITSKDNLNKLKKAPKVLTEIDSAQSISKQYSTDEGEHLSATESMQMDAIMENEKQQNKYSLDKEEESFESIGELTLSTISPNSTGANETVIKIETPKSEKSQHMTHESFVDSLELEKLKMKEQKMPYSLPQPMKKVSFEQERLNFLRQKNCELLGRKLMRCNELEERMKYLVEKFTARELDLGMKNRIIKQENTVLILEHDNMALKNELNAMREKNVKLNEDITRYKHLANRQNMTSGEEYTWKSNRKESSNKVNEDLDLQAEINQLLKENSEFKNEIKNLKLEKLVETRQERYALPNQINTEDDISEISERSIPLDETENDIHTSETSVMLKPSKNKVKDLHPVVAISKSDGEIRKKPEISRPPAVPQNGLSDVAPRKPSRPSRPSRLSLPQQFDMKAEQSKQSINLKESQGGSSPVSKPASKDLFSVKNLQTATQKSTSVSSHSNLDSSKDETDSVGKASITSTGSRKMSFKRLKFWKGKNK